MDSTRRTASTTTSIRCGSKVVRGARSHDYDLEGRGSAAGQFPLMPFTKSATDPPFHGHGHERRQRLGQGKMSPAPTSVCTSTTTCVGVVVHPAVVSNSLCGAPMLPTWGHSSRAFPPGTRTKVRRRRMPTEPRRPVMVSTPRKSRHHWPVNNSRHNTRRCVRTLPISTRIGAIPDKQYHSTGIARCVRDYRRCNA